MMFASRTRLGSFPSEPYLRRPERTTLTAVSHSLVILVQDDDDEDDLDDEDHDENDDEDDDEDDDEAEDRPGWSD
jgi:hypothetical protein